MNAITPYQRRAAVNTVLRLARSPAVRGTAYRAANTIYRAYRRYSARRRATPRRIFRNPNRQAKNVRVRIGMPVGSNTCKRAGIARSGVDAVYNTRTLYTWELTNIDQGDAPNQRERDILNFRGVKICADFINKAISPPTPTPGNRPLLLYVRWAVVSPKYSLAVQQNAFFRSYGSNRNIRFGHEGLSYMDYYCRPLNIDAMHVLSTGRFMLNNEVAWAAANPGKQAKKVMKWIPVKRQIRYVLGDEDVEFASTKLYFIMWCDVAGTAEQGEDIAPTIYEDVLALDMKLVSFFREPKN